ncbi:hypothetical protein [Fusobacterium necrophorum]|uniref:hypothetical protein n=1 Tax=Fusobacterium necrophorum TaxID=859 RepID=UPI000D13CEAD|nr:hypothetical protein [Fusobacterium necrophorum]AVQ20719.1 hypothetical protein C4N15_03300 [Fusobacterium necrophorum subsp. funduliforme]
MYIYLDKQQAKKNTALVKWCYETRLENYNQEELVEYIANDIPHFITYVEETDSIREATEEEKLARKQIELADNEVIIDNVIYNYDKKYQKVVNNQIVDKSLKELVEEGIITLDYAKNKKREELKIIRKKKISSHLKVKFDKEYEFQMRNNDVSNFLGFKSTLDTLKMLGVDKPEDISKLSAFHLPEEILKKIKTFLETGKVGWILTNNSITLFSFEQILLINTLYQLRKEEIFIEFGKLSIQLEKCKSTEEIEKIVWE